MGELGGNPEMQKEFERMMAELVAAGQAGSDEEAMKHIGHATEAVNRPPGPETAEAKAAGSKKSGQNESFQDTIRKTMERMQGSSDSASAAAASGSENSEEALLAQMMAQLQAGGGGGEGGEEDFSKMLMSMMTQLTNKDILYEPMKELHDKFPPWLEKHKGEVEKVDLERYLEQQKLVDEIVNRFERKEYSDDNEDDREYIVERMQKASLTSDEWESADGTEADIVRADARCRFATTRSCGRHERRTRGAWGARLWMSNAVRTGASGVRARCWHGVHKCVVQRMYLCDTQGLSSLPQSSHNT